MLRPRSSGRGFESPCRQHNPDTFFAHENTSTVAFDNGSVASNVTVRTCDGYCSIVVSTSRCGRDILGSTPGSSKDLTWVSTFAHSSERISCIHGEYFDWHGGSAGAFAGLAQSVERQALNLVVVGSSPTVGEFYSYGYAEC